MKVDNRYQRHDLDLAYDRARMTAARRLRAMSTSGAAPVDAETIPRTLLPPSANAASAKTRKSRTMQSRTMTTRTTIVLVVIRLVVLLPGSVVP